MVVLCRDMDVEDAIELGRRSIYHATFRDAVSGGTVSGILSLLLLEIGYGFSLVCMCAQTLSVSGLQCTMSQRMAGRRSEETMLESCTMSTTRLLRPILAIMLIP